MRRFWSAHRRLLFFLVIFVALGVVFVASPGHVLATSHNTAGAQNPDDGNNVIARVLTAAILGVIQLLGKLLTIAVSGIVAVSEYNDFINALAVVNGWVIVRDVANMFFIIVLLIIAFGTILGQEEYHYKKLLPKMLILAVLVNFSRTIIGVMIDFSQVVMLTFVNGYKAAAGGNFANIFQIINLLKFSKEGCTTGANPNGVPGDWGIFGAALLALIMVIVSIITVAVILAVLVVRVITLWLLTVLSPLAFLAGTFPQGQKYYAQWWEEFKNMVMVGPLLAFFLWLSLVTVGSGNAISQITKDGKAIIPVEAQINSTCSQVGTTDAIMSFIIGNLMLLAGTQMAQQMGGTIAGIAGQARGAATRALKFGAKSLAAPFAGVAVLAGRRVQRSMLDASAHEGAGFWRRSLKYIAAPQQSIAGVMQRGKTLDEESRQRAFAAAQDDADQVLTFGKIKRYNLRTTEASQRQHLAQQFAPLGRTEQAELMNKMRFAGGREAEDYRRALVISGATKGYPDDYAETVKDEYGKLNEERYGVTDGSFYDDRILGDILMDYLTGSKAGEGRAEMMHKPKHHQAEFAVLADLEEIGKAAGHAEYIGHGGEKKTTGENRGLWTGTQETAYRYTTETLPDGRTRKVKGARLGQDFDDGIMTGRIKYNRAQNAFIGKDKQGRDVREDGAGMMFRNDERIGWAVGEWKKLSGRRRMEAAPHGIMPRSVNETGEYDTGYQLTPMEEAIASNMDQSGEQRALQARHVDWAFGGTDNFTVDPANFVLEVKDQGVLKRLEALRNANPILIPMLFGQAIGQEARNFTKNELKVKVKGSDRPEDQATIKWTPFGKSKGGGGGGAGGAEGGDGGEGEGGGGGDEGGGSSGGGDGGGATVNVNVNAGAIADAVRQAVSESLSQLEIPASGGTGSFEAQQANMVKQELDRLKGLVENMGNALDEKLRRNFDEIYAKMREVGHQSAEFADYFRRNFKREDWKKVVEQAKK